ncbi:rRNA-processing protein FCF1 homolog isoform X1 [Panulirus ornatus]|uniref:rRNA-processing protein FCF1 homolog isoform X1 n=2 Tax=Panulirus ornatus TaxID=150431 RepID=UPI003A8A453E
MVTKIFLCNDKFARQFYKHMPKAKKTRKFAVMKRMISLSDPRLKEEDRMPKKKKIPDPHEKKIIEAPQHSSALFFEYNTQLGPPYRILIDTNFVNFAIKNKVDIVKGMMDCLFAKCIPCVTECVQGELEQMGERYRLALKIIKDPRMETLPCLHKGIYADDCLVQRIKQHKCYIVATCDRDLKRRIRKIPGVPIMCVSQHKFVIERMPDAPQM